jgi:hypothetical protein
VSRGFLCTLFGLGMTVFSWLGPWAWPAWPAFGVQILVFGRSGGSFAELPFGVRAAFIVVLIIANSAAWAFAAAAVLTALSAIIRRSGQFERPSP